MCNKSASFKSNSLMQNFVKKILSEQKIDMCYMVDRLEQVCPLEVYQAMDTALFMQNTDPSNADGAIRSMILKISRAAVYGVDAQEKRLDWVVPEKGEAPYVSISDEPEHGRARLLGENVFRVHFDSNSVEDAISVIKRIEKGLPGPVQFLGVKNQSIRKVSSEDGVQNIARKCAVFMKGENFRDALIKTFGEKAAIEVLKRDKGPDATFLSNMLNAEGQRATHELFVDLPNYMDHNEEFDGLLADLDKENWDAFLRAFCLNPHTKWAQVRILSKDQGIVVKGTIRLCPDEDKVGYRTYTKSWKIGMHGGYINTKDIILCETDHTYRPDARMNLQMFAYNLNADEKRLIIDSIIKPGLEKLNTYDWLSKVPELERFKQAGGPLELIAPRVNEIRKSMALDGISHQNMDGVRLKAAPWPGIGANMVLIPWWVRKNFKLEIGDSIDILRDPSLPCGNSIQRYTVAGVHQGNTVMMGRDPWMTIQGGDFDGDDACLLVSLTKILPNKTWDQTPVKALTPKKGEGEGMEPIKNIQDYVTRMWMAVKTMGAAIGIYDIAARRLSEINKLDANTALLLSKGVQTEIDSMKHDIKMEPIEVEVPKGPNRGRYDIDFIRAGMFNLVNRNGIYGPIVDMALNIYHKDIEQRKFPKKEIQAKWNALINEYAFNKVLIANATKLGRDLRDAFAIICNKERSSDDNNTEGDIRKLVGYTHNAVDNMVAEELKRSSIDPEDSDVIKLLIELAIMKESSLFFGIRAVSMMTLCHVYGE